MADVVTRVRPAAGFASATVATLVAGLDDETHRILEDVKDCTPADLAWQPGPGMNTMGMLLAHIAVAETHLTEVGLLAKPDSDLRAVLGIGMEDDGMPLPEDGVPPPALAGRGVDFFADLLGRARAHLKRAAAGLTDADLDRDVVRPRPDGDRRVFNLRWVLYHALEHTAGHHGQVLMLKHLRRGAR